jgi:hypothetical protein
MEVKKGKKKNKPKLTYAQDDYINLVSDEK